MPLKRDEFWEAKSREKILVIGLGVTGQALSKLLLKKKITFAILIDRPATPEEKEFLEKIKFPLSDFYEGEITKNKTNTLLNATDEIIISPGFPRHNPFLKKAKKNGIPILSEIDFFFPLLQKKKIIAITGTNGKTTITKLCEQILKTKYKVFCGGNIGIPLGKVVDKIASYDVLLLEISSYMLEEIQFFHPQIAVITNLGKDHLDRYANFKKYLKTKFNLIRYTEKKAIFIKNIDDPYIRKRKIKNLNVITVSSNQKADFFIKKNWIYKSSQKILNLEKSKMITPPINLLIATTIGSICQVSQLKIKKAIESSKNLENRLEKVYHKKHLIYNDSKATTLESVITAINLLSSKHAKKIRLILGGRGKNFSFKQLKKYSSKISKLYLYGEEGEKIQIQLKELEPTFFYSFEKITTLAYQELTDQEILLLSPGCSSFDQFANYELRGIAFKKIIASLN